MEELTPELYTLYATVLDELCKEGNEAALTARASITNMHDWVRNIHYNTWGTNSLGSTIKSRIILKRIRK